MTPQELEEFMKCKKDFKYFALNYLKIIHPKKGLIPFRLYPFQERVVKDFENHQYCITKKFRQAGLTTVTSMWMLWRCLFFTDQRVMILSKSDREAKGVGKTVAQAKNNLPKWLLPEMGNDNDHEKEFKETGSVMWFFTPTAARSRSLTYLVIDEAAFIDNMEEHWKAMYPTLATGGNCIVISTVNGMGGKGGWYYETYNKALEKKNQFHIIHIDWREHPDYNNADWEKRTRANLGPKAFAQEIEGDFLGSGETFIPLDVICEYGKQCTDPIKKMLGEWDTIPEVSFDEEELPNKEYEPGALWVWEMPKPGKEYMLVADVADGVGSDGDNCAFIIMDINSLTQVAEFYSNTIPPFKFSQIIKQVGDMYNKALVIIENTVGSGNAVCQRLEHSLNYENLYYTQGTNKDKPGISLNKNVRPMCMEALQTCMLNKLIKIRSNRLIRELKTFIYDRVKQRPQAQRGRHDDLVVCLAILLYVADVIHREVPIGMPPPEDIINKSLMNSDFDLLKAEIENGLFDNDFLEIDLEPEINLIPISGDSLMPRRPHDALLREFGF